METISIIYKTKEQMLSFIKTNELETISNLLIQACCEKASKMFIKQLQQNINEILPKATLIGSSVSKLNENNTANKTTLTFSSLPEMDIQSDVFDYEENLINIDYELKKSNKIYNQQIADVRKKGSNKSINMYVFNNSK
ncbi:MAG: hypothetical protein WCR33_06710, partial [Bacilli bacterium]